MENHWSYKNLSSMRSLAQIELEQAISTWLKRTCLRPVIQLTLLDSHHMYPICRHKEDTIGTSLDSVSYPLCYSFQICRLLFVVVPDSCNQGGDKWVFCFYYLVSNPPLIPYASGDFYCFDNNNIVVYALSHIRHLKQIAILHVIQKT